jgi:formamidopyrimidine-DNA glycosylase
MRKLGGVWLARDEPELRAITGRLGPDAAQIDREAFDELLADRRGAIKPALMNQKLFAGVGNELSDEILWHARLHPRRPVSSLEAAERTRLFEALRKVVAESSRRGRIPREPGWLTASRGHRDASCPRCRARVRRETVGGRTAYWCPRCQPDG